MDLPMLVGEIRDQLQALPVEAKFEVRLDGRRVRPVADPAVLTVAQEAVKAIALVDLRVGCLPLKLPLALPAAETPGFCMRVSESLRASLREGPVWLERSARTAVFLGRRLYSADLALPCEVEVGSAAFSTCSTHGWELVAVRIRTLTLPDFAATFHMLEMRRAEN
jgi:hypothetical protein